MNASEHDKADRAMGRDTRTVAGMTLISRFMGLVRDLVTVRVFGDTAVGSAFAAAFAIPNMFRRLFGEGALSAAFIPEYTRLNDQDPRRADQLASLTVGMLALVTGGLTVLIELGILAVLLLAPGNEERTLSLRLVMVCLPFMPLICVAAILGGMLQAKGSFGPWAAAPIILNLCIIAAALPPIFIEGSDPAFWAYPISIAATVSGALQVVWSLWALRGRVHWTRGVAEVRDQGRAMLRRMGPVLIGLGTLQLNSFMDTLIAMWPNWVGPTIAGHDYPLDEKANAVLFYAQRLYQFPLGVFGIAVATAAFPMLSRDAKDPARFVATLRRGLRLSLFIALPASVGLVVLREPLVRCLFSGGDGFSEDGVRRAALVLAGYSAAIWAYSLNQLFTRAFYAAGDTRTPMRIALWMVGLNLTLNMTLIWWLREAGLAWSTAISAGVQTLLLAAATRRRLTGQSLLDGPTARAVGGQLVGTAFVAAASLGVLWLWREPSGWWGVAGRTGAGVGAGAGVYAAWTLARRAPELRWLLGRSVGGTMGAAPKGDPLP